MPSGSWWHRNPAGQIVSNSRSDDSYAYTGHANASVADSHDGLNQILTTGGLAVDHNNRGDIIALPTPGSPAGNVTEYSYSDEDRLVAAEVDVTLTYDPLGRLYQVSSPTGVRRFAYDGIDVIGEYDAAGTYLHRYVHGAGQPAPADAGEPIVWDDRSLFPTLSRRYAHADERGSIIAWSDSTGVDEPIVWDDRSLYPALSRPLPRAAARASSGQVVLDPKSHCQRGISGLRWRRERIGLGGIQDMKQLEAWLLAAAALGIAAAAMAAETITYVYDARGRLIKVVHTGTVNNGVNTVYSYDKADNRTNKTTTGAPQ